jgi:hypothetical protein
MGFPILLNYFLLLTPVGLEYYIKQGKLKKRHLHAQRIVSFMYNPEAQRRGHLLKCVRFLTLMR